MPKINMLNPVVTKSRKALLGFWILIWVIVLGWIGVLSGILKINHAPVAESSSAPTFVYSVPIKIESPDAPMPKNGMSDNDLYDEYDLINSRYFEGKLPNAVLRFEVMPGYLGLTQEAGSTNPIIHINPDLTPSGKEVIETLLHEICHAHLKGPRPLHGSDHGREFQACMRSLADRGAFAEVW